MQFGYVRKQATLAISQEQVAASQEWVATALNVLADIQIYLQYQAPVADVRVALSRMQALCTVILESVVNARETLVNIVVSLNVNLDLAMSRVSLQVSLTQTQKSLSQAEHILAKRRLETSLLEQFQTKLHESQEALTVVLALLAEVEGSLRNAHSVEGTWEACEWIVESIIILSAIV